MSRTKKGSKGAGYDYWSRRPHSGHHGYGSAAKQKTIRSERQEDKELLKAEAEAILDDVCMDMLKEIL